MSEPPDRGPAGAPRPSSSAGRLTGFAAARGDRSLAVLEGFHALKHALRFGAEVERAVTSDAEQLSALAHGLAPDLAERLRALVSPVSREELRALAPQLPHTEVLSLARRPPFDLAAALRALPSRPVILLEDPRHLGNVGAVVRVAAAADAAAVLTTGPRDPWDPAALRGAAGLHYALPVGTAGETTGEALEALAATVAHGRGETTGEALALAATVAHGRGETTGEALALAATVAHTHGKTTGQARARSARPLVALHPEGDLLTTTPIPPGALLAFGTERHGLSDELLARADARIRLPMREGVSSLNLATAVAATLYAGAMC